MRMRIDNPALRGVIGLGIFAAVLALSFAMLSSQLSASRSEPQAVLLFFAGPVGAMVTHLHVPLFALLVLLMLPFVIAAAVSRSRRRLFVLLTVSAWFALGAMFASIPSA